MKIQYEFLRVSTLCCCVFLVSLLFCVQDAGAKQFTRKVFKYEKMKIKEARDCDKSRNEMLNLALDKLDLLQSREALISAKKVYSRADKCPAAYGVYAWCLFRSGEWLKALKVIDGAIEKYGPYPAFVKLRANMGKEMGDLGTTQKEIDGNSVYLPKRMGLPYDEGQFRKENYKAALNDFLYLIRENPEKYDDTYSAAYLYFRLGNYWESNRLLERLLSVDEFRSLALMGLTNNYLAMKQFAQAEKMLSEMEAQDPRSASVQEQFVNLYTAMGNTGKAGEHEKKLQFYTLAPSFSDLEFTEENFDLLTFFAGEGNNAGEKEKKLDAILKGEDKEFAIDICMALLVMHPHGTRLEDMSANGLIRFGKDSVPKTIKLLQSNGISTCTITIAADILATVKDERGWQALVDCLPAMARIPSTLIPPSIPDKIVKFDRERGIKILLPFMRDMIRADQNGDDSKDPAATQEKFMVYLAFYAPLKTFERNELIKLARDNGYTEKETRMLLENVSIE